MEAESPVLAALLKGNYFLLLGMYIDAASAIETLSGLIDEETNPENIFHYQVCRLFLETFHLMLLERNADVRDIQFRHEAFVEDLESLIDEMPASNLDYVPSVDNPDYFELRQNYPNPFNPTTMIDYGLAKQSEVTLSVYNVGGQLVEVIQNGFQQAGYHSVEWTPGDLPSGVYFVEMQAAGFRDVMKISYVK